MIVDIHFQGFTVTQAPAEQLRRRLAFVLARHSDRIQRVAVRVGDENGPRGGMGKFCRIQVQLLNAPVAVIEDVGAELYAVIDRAADRVGRVVVMRLDRTHPVRDAARHGAPLAEARQLLEAADVPHHVHAAVDDKARCIADAAHVGTGMALLWVGGP